VNGHNTIHKKGRRPNTRFDWRPDHVFSVTSGTKRHSGPEKPIQLALPVAHLPAFGKKE
jgi:hypothetical protein